MNKDFTSNGFLEKNLEAMREKLIEKDNKDMVILVVGSPGSGKSALTAFCYQYLRPEEHDSGNVVYTHEPFISSIKQNSKESFIWYDEGYNSFYRRNAMTNKNKESMSALMQYRYKNHTMFINFQNISDLEPDLLYKRCHAVIRVVKKGFFHFFSQRKAREIDIDGNKTSWPDPDFRGSFPDPEKEIPDFWQEVEERNQESLEEDEEEEDDGTTFLKPSEVAEKLRVTPATVHNWCKDGKLEHKKIVGGKRRIPKKEIEDMIGT